MRLSSKELMIIFIEFLIAIFLFVLSSNFVFKRVVSSSIFNFILFIVIIGIVVALVFMIIYRRIGEIDEALEKQEIKQEGLKEKLIRYEQLIDIKSNIIDLQRRIKNIENGKKSRIW